MNEFETEQAQARLDAEVEEAIAEERGDVDAYGEEDEFGSDEAARLDVQALVIAGQPALDAAVKAEGIFDEDQQVTTVVRDVFTFEWDGKVPVAPQTWGTAEETMDYLDTAKAYADPEHAARYGRIVKCTVTTVSTPWTPAL
jgi:hypothetical protein